MVRWRFQIMGLWRDGERAVLLDTMYLMHPVPLDVLLGQMMGE